MSRRKILAIGAHFDDVELGCGGTLIRHHEAGDNVCIHVLTKSGYVGIGSDQRTNEAAYSEGAAAAKLIGATLSCSLWATHTLSPGAELVGELVGVIQRVAPDRIYCHTPADPHLDHSAIGQSLLLAARDVPEILFYRSSFHQAVLPFCPSYFVDITPYLERKLAVISVYQSQSHKLDMWKAAWRGQAMVAGATALMKYAEAFEIFRFRWGLQ